MRTRLESINLEKQEIERKCTKLRADALDLLRAYKPVEKDLLKESEIYSSAWGQSFGAILLKSLPREIRDIIYAELITIDDPVFIPSLVEVDPWWEWSMTKADRVQYENCMKHITDRCQPLVSPEFLGPVVSQEIMWAFYEKNLFHLHEIELLKSFLTTDIFGKGCAPSDFVRNLRIGMLDSTFLEGWSWDPTDADSVVPVRSSERLAHLNHLDIIKNKSGLELTFLIRAGRRYVSHQLIYNIGITVFRLRDHGFKVKVAQEMKKKKSKRWKLQSSKKLYAWPGADWTFLLDGDREEWQRKAERQELHTDVPREHELGDWDIGL